MTLIFRIREMHTSWGYNYHHCPLWINVHKFAWKKYDPHHSGSCFRFSLFFSYFECQNQPVVLSWTRTSALQTGASNGSFFLLLMLHVILVLHKGGDHSEKLMWRIVIFLFQGKIQNISINETSLIQMREDSVLQRQEALLFKFPLPCFSVWKLRIESVRLFIFTPDK